MQVPAYWPSLVGVHDVENSGVRAEVKKVMVIDVLVSMSMSMLDEAVAVLDMDMVIEPVLVAVAVAVAMDIVVMPISMLRVLVFSICCVEREINGG